MKGGIKMNKKYLFIIGTIFCLFLVNSVMAELKGYAILKGDNGNVINIGPFTSFNKTDTNFKASLRIWEKKSTEQMFVNGQGSFVVQGRLQELEKPRDFRLSLNFKTISITGIENGLMTNNIAENGVYYIERSKPKLARCEMQYKYYFDRMSVDVTGVCNLPCQKYSFLLNRCIVNGDKINFNVINIPITEI